MDLALFKKHSISSFTALATILVAVLLMMGLVKNNDHGIEIKSVRLSAMGYMLDVRYQVNDPERASKMITKSIKPYIVEEETGARLFVPIPGKVGPLRQISQNPVKGNVYFMMFANPGRRLKTGHRITLVIGDYKARHLAIQ